MTGCRAPAEKREKDKGKKDTGRGNAHHLALRCAENDINLWAKTPPVKRLLNTLLNVLGAFIAHGAFAPTCALRLPLLNTGTVPRARKIVCREYPPGSSQSTQSFLVVGGRGYSSTLHFLRTRRRQQLSKRTFFFRRDWRFVDHHPYNHEEPLSTYIFGKFRKEGGWSVFSFVFFVLSLKSKQVRYKFWNAL